MQNILSGSSRSRRFFALAFLVAVPFASVNLAGCGGGSGGGPLGGGTPVAKKVTVTFQLFDESGDRTDGTVTLGEGAMGRTQQSVSSGTTFTEVPAGTYTVIFTSSSGVTTRGTIVVANDATQSFKLQSGSTTVPPRGLTISGRVLLNTGNAGVNNCGSTNTPITARVVVRVRETNSPDRPIVASTEKPNQTSGSISQNQRGAYEINGLPGPGTYEVEVVSASPTAADPNPGTFTGRSAIVTITTQSEITGLNVCANPGSSPPPSA